MPRKRIAVVGLGYVGLPLACLFAEKGFGAIGIDTDAAKVDLVGRGQSPFPGKEPGLAELLCKVVRDGRLVATSDLEECGKAKAVFICVDTPIDEDKCPVLDFLKKAVGDVGKELRNGMLVSVESTLPPGTMQKVVIPLLEKSSGLKAGRNFFILYCPERINPGRSIESLKKNERVIGSIDSRSLKKGLEYYSAITEAELHPTDLLTAEIVKTVENAYRDVQIAFANEVALVCEELGADAYEVRRLVNTSPFRDMHFPGSGVGGHCLTKDSWLLASALPEKCPPLISAARAINDSMPDHLASLATEALRETGRRARGSKITILGLAFRRDLGDTRNSPALPILDRFRRIAQVAVHDPYAQGSRGLSVVRDVYAALEGSDCAIFVTDHSEYGSMDLGRMAKVMRTRIIVDGRNIFDAEECRRRGFVYKGIGKGERVSSSSRSA